MTQRTLYIDYTYYSLPTQTVMHFGTFDLTTCVWMHFKSSICKCYI